MKCKAVLGKFQVSFGQWCAREDIQIFPQCISSVSSFCVLKLSSVTFMFNKKQYLFLHSTTIV